MISLTNLSAASECVIPGASQSTLQDFRFPDSSGGYGFKDSPSWSLPTSNRFIVWKISKDTIDFHEMSTDIDLIGNQVKLRLQNTQLLEGISVNETDQQVIILVTTVGSVHRILLPHPKTLPAVTSQYGGNRPCGLSIFNAFNVDSLKDPRNYYVLPNYFASGGSSSSTVGFRSPTSCCSWVGKDNEAVFVLGNSSGSLLVIQMHPYPSFDQDIVMHSDDFESAHVFELKQTNLIDKLKGFVPSIIRSAPPEGEEAALYLISHSFNEDTLIFVFCRDIKLRVWSYVRKRIVATLDVAQVSQGAQLETSLGGSSVAPSVRRPLVRKTIINRHLHVVVFVNSGDQREFIAFRVDSYQAGKIGMTRVASLCPGHEEDVIDFKMFRDELICLVLDSKTDFRVKSSSIQDFQSEWSFLTTGLLSSSCSTEDLKHWSNEEFVEEIFHLGRFLPTTVGRALSAFTRTSIESWTRLKLHEMSSKAVKEVEHQTRIRCTGSQVNVKDVEREAWEKLLTYCLQYQAVSRKPLGLFVDPETRLLALIQKSVMTFVTESDETTKILIHSSRSSPVISLDLSLASDEPALIPSLNIVLDAIRLVTNSLTVEAAHLFERQLHEGKDADEAAKNVIQQFLNDSSGSQLGLSIQSCFDRIHILAPALASSLEQIIRSLDLTCHLEIQDGSPVASPLERLFTSLVGRSVLREGLVRFSRTRFEFSRDLLIFSEFILQTRNKIGLTMDKIEALRTCLLPSIISQVHGYFILDWFASISFEDPYAVSTQKEVDEAHLNVLQLTEYIRACNLTEACQDENQNFSLLELFISDRGLSPAKILLSTKYTDNDNISLETWETVLPDFVECLAQLIWPLTQTLLVPEFLLGYKQYNLLSKYMNLMKSWYRFNQYTWQFMLGFVDMVHGRSIEAVDRFEDAVLGIHEEPFLRRFCNMDEAEEEMQLEHPPTIEDLSGVMFNYFNKVIQLLKNQGDSNAVIALSQHSLLIQNKGKVVPGSEMEDRISRLYTTLFVNYIHLDDYRRAYDVMVLNPDPIRKKDCLRQLIVHLYDAGKRTELLSFDYNDLSAEFIHIIETKARSSDLSSPSGCGYYDILHAIFFNANNYRKAASIMYEFGTRLSREVPGIESLEQQVNCLMSTINLLKLLPDQKYAWILKPVVRMSYPSDPLASIPRLEPESRKRTSIDDDKTKPVQKREIHVLAVEDIKTEYELTRTRLRLLVKDAKLNSIANGPLSPEEIVTLLISNSLYDLAFKISSMNDLSFKPIFEGLVSKYVRLIQLPILDREDNGFNEISDIIADNDHIAQTFLATSESSASCKMWDIIMLYLDKFEKKGLTGFHRVVAERLLITGVGVPPSLKNSYAKRDTSELILLLMTYNCIEESADLAIGLIDNLLERRGDSISNTLQPLYMPHSHVLNLIQMLEEDKKEQQHLVQVQKNLVGRLRTFEDMTRQESAFIFQ